MQHGNLIVEYRPVGPFAMNAYVIGCAETKQGAIVDSGGETDTLLAMAEKHELKIVKLLQTHAHIDHIGGLGSMKEQTQAPIFLHPDDTRLYETAPMQAQMFGLRVDAPPPVDHPLKDGQTIALGSLEFEVFHTPGHCPGHVCFYTQSEQVLFAGDLIFRGSIGRTDLPGADPAAMMRSLKRMVETIPDPTTIYPGHMQPTDMARERRTNPFLRML